jgi:hypothetical protein
MARRTTAILILVIGIAHLLLAGRGLLYLDEFIGLAIGKAKAAGDPMTSADHWRVVAMIVLSWCVVAGGGAVFCGVGILREWNVARRVWLAATMITVPFYSFGLVRYLQSGSVGCAIAAGAVVAVELGTSSYLLSRRGRRSFREGQLADAT